MGWGEGDILPFRRHEAWGRHTGVFLSILLGTLFVGVLWKVHGKLPGPCGAPSVLSIVSSLLLTPELHTSPHPSPPPARVCTLELVLSLRMRLRKIRREVLTQSSRTKHLPFAELCSECLAGRVGVLISRLFTFGETEAQSAKRSANK